MNLFAKMRRNPRVSASLAILAGVVLVPAALFAWGPARDTYTVEKPADHIVFNSITNNPVYGDERQFASIKDASNTTAGGWQNTVTAQAGKEYLVRVYVHNNAADKLGLVATNTRVMAALSTATGTNVPVTTYVSADNASPKQVYADVKLTAAQNFNIAYVPGSAKIYNNATGQAGRAVSDSIVNGSGALVGYNANDGKVPGCFQYASYVTFKVKPQFAQSAEFDMSKVVRKAGTTTWSESVAAKSGETVQYRIKYTNTGKVQQNNVVVRDTLPAGVSYVAGSTKLYLGSDPTNARAVSDNIVNATGINIGSYLPGGMAMVIFDAKVKANDQLPVCGPNTLRNIAKVETDYGTKQDTADVTTTKECVQPKDIQVCRLSDKKIVTIKETEFDAQKYSKNLDDCKPVVKDIQVCELATKKVITIKETEFNSTKHSKNLDDCKTVVIKDIEVCRLSDKKIVTIKENEFDAKLYSKNLNDCKPVVVKNIEVCRLSDKQVVTIKETEFDSEKYSKDLNDCKETPAPKTIEVCRLSDKTFPVTINESEFDSAKYSKDANDCEVTPPVVPTELPKTGLADGISGLAGIGSLIAASSYYVASRRAIKN
jgi:uncharacterized repeat protein (TIGR01451 family)